uniref:Uncharacterized protein n=1 Tax=Heterorhabditis bacteriophora TaxID=37862 RepID=A0A1I7WPF6_HETBA
MVPINVVDTCSIKELHDMQKFISNTIIP